MEKEICILCNSKPIAIKICKIFNNICRNYNQHLFDLIEVAYRKYKDETCLLFTYYHDIGNFIVGYASFDFFRRDKRIVTLRELNVFCKKTILNNIIGIRANMTSSFAKQLVDEYAVNLNRFEENGYIKQKQHKRKILLH